MGASGGRGMIHRNSRNIGKTVRYTCSNPIWDGKIGIIKGFRGNAKNGVPYVSVYMHGHGIMPFRGDFLTEVKIK